MIRREHLDAADAIDAAHAEVFPAPADRQMPTGPAVLDR
jgi:hypothetical protein